MTMVELDATTDTATATKVIAMEITVVTAMTLAATATEDMVATATRATVVVAATVMVLTVLTAKGTRSREPAIVTGAMAMMIAVATVTPMVTIMEMKVAMSILVTAMENKVATNKPVTKVMATATLMQILREGLQARSRNLDTNTAKGGVWQCRQQSSTLSETSSRASVLSSLVFVSGCSRWIWA